MKLEIFRLHNISRDEAAAWEGRNVDEIDSRYCWIFADFSCEEDFKRMGHEVRCKVPFVDVDRLMTLHGISRDTRLLYIEPSQDTPLECEALFVYRDGKQKHIRFTRSECMQEKDYLVRIYSAWEHILTSVSEESIWYLLDMQDVEPDIYFVLTPNMLDELCEWEPDLSEKLKDLRGGIYAGVIEGDLTE